MRNKIVIRIEIWTLIITILLTGISCMVKLPQSDYIYVKNCLKITPSRQLCKIDKDSLKIAKKNIGYVPILSITSIYIQEGTLTIIFPENQHIICNKDSIIISKKGNDSCYIGRLLYIVLHNDNSSIRIGIALTNGEYEDVYLQLSNKKTEKYSLLEILFIKSDDFTGETGILYSEPNWYDGYISPQK